MPNYSHHNLILVRFPFSDLTSSKVRPAVVVNAPHVSLDLIIVPLTKRRVLESPYGQQNNKQKKLQPGRIFR
jgi:hypothetical protein